MGRTYYYLRVGTKSVGGPYSSLDALARGVRRASRKYPTMEAFRLVSGVWYPLTEAEAEGLTAMVNG